MKVIYVPDGASNEDFERSIFLAGPTPRSQSVKSWRPEFIQILADCDFNGTVLVPENEDGIFKQDYIDQVEWEYVHLCESTGIVFWIPRDLETLPGFTTNVEFGYCLNSKKHMFYGRPDGAPKTKYLDWMYEEIIQSPPCNSMQALVCDVLNWLK